MSIENLKKILESESNGSGIKYDEESCIISLDDKEIGQWNNEASQDYPEDLIWRRDISGFHHKAFKAGHESATNRLLPLLQKMMKVVEFYGKENSWDEMWVDGDGLEDDGGDCSCKIDWEDIELKKDNDGAIYYSCGGKKAREFLLSLSETTESVFELTKMTEIKKEG